MGVDVVRSTVGRPPSVSDSGVPIVERIRDEFIAQGLQFPRTLSGLQIVGDDGDTGRVVSAVLESSESPEEDLL